MWSLSTIQSESPLLRATVMVGSVFVALIRSRRTKIKAHGKGYEFLFRPYMKYEMMAATDMADKYCETRVEW